MNRRTAIQAFIAGCAAPLAWLRGSPTPKPANDFTIEIPVRADMTPFKRQVREALADMGDIPPEPKGVLGKTYFRAQVRPDITSAGLRCYFNGVDVHERAQEADAVGGWVYMLDVDGAGRRLPRRRTHFGKVEFRPV